MFLGMLFLELHGKQGAILFYIHFLVRRTGTHGACTEFTAGDTIASGIHAMDPLLGSSHGSASYNSFGQTPGRDPPPTSWTYSSFRHRSPPPPPPGLPPGKTHHIFFSHSSSDQNVVYQWAARLEDDYGLACFLPDRDFIPGRPVMSLIADGMSRCLKIVLVLSPEYVDSAYCDYERLLAFTLCLEERQNCIIPIMLHPCQAPDALLTLNYIDVERCQDVAEKIVQALTFKCDLRNILPNFLNTAPRQACNGTRHQIQATKKRPSLLCGTAWTFPGPTVHSREVLRGMGGELSGEMYTILRKSLNISFSLRHHNVLYMGLPLVVLCTLGFMMTLAMGVAVIAAMQWVYRFEDMDILIWSAYYTSVQQVLYFLLFFVIWRKIKITNKNHAERLVENLSLKWLPETGLLIFYTEDPRPTMVFLCYDAGPCRDHIRDRYMRLYNQTDGSTEEERLNRADETAAEKIREFLAQNYDKFFSWSVLDESRTHRHLTLMRKKCICEYVEEYLWGDTSSVI